MPCWKNSWPIRPCTAWSILPKTIAAGWKGSIYCSILIYHGWIDWTWLFEMFIKAIMLFYFYSRSAWIIVFILGLGVSVYLSLGMWQKLYSSPLLMSIESTDVPVSQFEFPSVVVCSQTRLSKLRLEQTLTSSKFRGFTYDELKMTMRIMMKPESAYQRSNLLNLVHKKLIDNGVTFEELINATLHVGIAPAIGTF